MSVPYSYHRGELIQITFRVCPTDPNPAVQHDRFMNHDEAIGFDLIGGSVKSNLIVSDGLKRHQQPAPCRDHSFKKNVKQVVRKTSAVCEKMRKYVKTWEIKRCTSCGASITSLLLTIKPTCEWVLQQFMQEESDSNETWGTKSFTSQYWTPTLWLSKWLSALHLKDISQEILWQVLSHFATEMLATDPLHSNHWVDNFRHYDYHILSLGPLASVGDDFVLLNWENKKRSSKLPSLLPSIDATVVACDVCIQKRWASLKWFENL